MNKRWDGHTDGRADPHARQGPRPSSESRLPSVWLGGAVACLTALGLVVGTLDGTEPRQLDATTQVSSTAPGSDTSASTTTAAPVRPVLVAGASITPVADLIRQVGGGRVEVVSVVPQGVDGHTYEPTPSDVADLVRADVTFLASTNLNPSVTRTVEANVPEDAVTVDLMAETVPSEEVIADVSHSHGSGGSHSHANVHVWTDPLIAMRWVNEIRDRLAALDPAGADTYRSNAQQLRRQIRTLHDATITATATVPAQNRTLVVYHDSWSYFGRTYGYDVIGALQAADFAEPSAAEVSNMVEQVRSSGVPAFFGAAVFPTEVLERVSEEAGVPYVADLADDELPFADGDPRHSYVGMMVENVRHIVTSLGGDASALDAVVL